MLKSFTGRINDSPEKLLHEEVLEPQFLYEAEHLLPSYVKIEQVMLIEYVRMGYISQSDASQINELLQSITPESLIADPNLNMSDILFAIESYVETLISKPIPGWHMDRSRNDVQACAQLMFAREQWLLLMKNLEQLIESLIPLALKYSEAPMPGYTHYQSAQIITPGFYLSAIIDELLLIFRRWIQEYNYMNICPLPAGAMAGVELEWDSSVLAKLLGFKKPSSNALKSVASRQWSLRFSAELSNFGVLTSRFVSDLIYWGSSEVGFIDLPENLSGISSAMPQKKNFPVLERVRGKCAHLSGIHFDIVLGQRNTPYTNLIETSKEAGSFFFQLCKTGNTIMILLDTVVNNLIFLESKMLSKCKQDFFGGFTLANLLTKEENIPYRKAQVIAGRYIVTASEQGLKPEDMKPMLLQEKSSEEGFNICNPEKILKQAFLVQNNLVEKQSLGSTHPDRVFQLLTNQSKELSELKENVEDIRMQLQNATEVRLKEISSSLI
ncbi:argininosuccinate lyase [Bacillus sp. ISL-53]|nr:argininosuccinate lyase [Bacillus sp. ISL-53]